MKNNNTAALKLLAAGVALLAIAVTSVNIQLKAKIDGIDTRVKTLELYNTTTNALADGTIDDGILHGIPTADDLINTVFADSSGGLDVTLIRPVVNFAVATNNIVVTYYPDSYDVFYFQGEGLSGAGDKYKFAVTLRWSHMEDQWRTWGISWEKVDN